MELIIVGIFFFLGFFGVLIILLKKIPVLAELPEKSSTNFLEASVLNFRDQIKDLNSFKNFSIELFLQKILSRLKVLILKIENLITLWLRKLREKSIEKNNHQPDNYWKELKGVKTKNVKKKS